MLNALRKLPVGTMLSAKSDAFPHITPRVKTNNFNRKQTPDFT